ncbi:MAG: tol-pal system protein YbgF [Thermodesulfovibrionia bacterium]|nr:tol-pal system protein YbgF [Thermodesulfovibrionia bacterium]
MDILKFFGLKEDPFKLTPDPGYFFSSECHKEALQSLDYVIEQREGFCLITGEPGTGKTTLIKIFIEKWKDNAEIALILTPRLSPEEFIVSVLDDLKIKYDNKGKSEILKVFRDFLLQKSYEKIPVIIIVDEAQSLPADTVEELRLLSNLETEKEKLLQILLVGQPELDEMLNEDSFRQLRQRITVSMKLKPLDSDEMLEYINYRLIKAGKGFLKLDKGLKKPIFAYSQGIPRKINLVSSRAIMSAFLEESSTITSKHVKYAINHLNNGSSGSGINLSPKIYYGLAAVMALLLVGASVYYYLPDVTTSTTVPSSAIANKAVSSSSTTAGEVYTPNIKKETNVLPSVELSEKANTASRQQNDITIRKNVSPEDLYRQGLEVFLTGKFDDALSSFKDFRKLYPKHALSEDVLYWSGEAYYAKGDYNSAISEFNKVVREYSGKKAPDALLMASSAFVKLNNKQKAEEVLKWLIEKYPDTRSAEKAKEKLKEIRLFP